MIETNSAWPEGASLPIRPIKAGDVPAIKTVIDATALFPSELLDSMIEGYLTDGASDAYWLTYDDGEAVAVAYCAPEQMTQGTWNLLLIAVRPDRQGRGYGKALASHLENTLAAQGERVLLVETSGLASFARTRAFYRRLNYIEEARIRDYYNQGEDKIVFWKALGLR